MNVSLEGLDTRHSKDRDMPVMNKTLHQNWKGSEISFLSACYETRRV